MHPKKRILLNIKTNLSIEAHEFMFECGYLRTYLDDSIALLKQANYLSPDAQIYSIESDKYFWSVSHTFYFTSSFVSLLMQVAEDLVNQCCTEWKLYLGTNLMIKSTDPFYEKFKISLLKNLQLDLNSPKWQDLSDLYQLRNALIHRNGRLDTDEKPERRVAVQNLIKRFHGLELSGEQIIIKPEFCKDALTIFEQALVYLFKETNSHINTLKKVY
jgi:hypothetical protein